MARKYWSSSDNVADVAIISAVRSEVDAFLSLCDPPAEALQDFPGSLGASTEFWTATIPTRKGQIIRTVIALCGVGRVNAAYVTSVVCTLFDPQLVINTGSAGALSDKLNIGDVVVGSTLTYGDVDNRIFNYQYGQLPDMPAVYSAPVEVIEKVRERFLQAVTESEIDTNDSLTSPLYNASQAQVHSGLIVTVESFCGTENQKNQILDHFPNALCVEMEGCAIVQVCYLSKKPCLVVRSISDAANSHVDYNTFAPLAAAHSARAVHTLLYEHVVDIGKHEGYIKNSAPTTTSAANSPQAADCY